MKYGYCRGCRKPIVFIKTIRGKDMPCEPDPVMYRQSESGKAKILTEKGFTINAEIVSDPKKADGRGYIPHWAHCSEAENFRK